MRKPKSKKFEKRGKSYVGYAIAIQTPTGSEIIILAPTVDEAEAVAACQIGLLNVDRSEIKQAALVGIRTFERMVAAMHPTTGKEP